MQSSSVDKKLASRALKYILRALKRHFGRRVNSVQLTTDAEFLRLLRSQTGIDSVPALLQHFRGRIAEQWPNLPNALTDLRIDLSRMTDKEIVERADGALEGDLHPSGVRPRITSEGRLDWASNPANSREWLLMIHRHAWWALWGAAYRKTGDEKYAEAFVAQLSDWIEQHPLPPQRSEHLESWRLMEAGLRMRVSWIPAFACFFNAPAFTDSTKLKMLRSIYDHGQFLHQFHTNRNHLVRESNGLVAVGLCFPEFAKSREWVERGLNRLDQELRAQVNADGSHIEMSVGYQWLAIDEFEVTRSLLSQYDRQLPTSDIAEILHKMYAFLASVIRPDRSFPQLNDGFILWDARRLEIAGRTFGWDDVEYSGSGGKSGSQPGFCSKSFPNAGLHVMRSDWTSSARYLISDTGPYGGPHGHEDKLSFELFAYGAPFIVDPGSYTYEKRDKYRSYFVGSQGHNTVLVDQRSQIRRWDAMHMNPEAQDVSHGYWRSDDEFDFASGTYSEGYAPFSLVSPEDKRVDNDVTHQRDFVFAKPDYWILVDYLAADNPHDYSFVFHLAPDMQIEHRTGSSALLRSRLNGAQLIMRAFTVQEIDSDVIEGQESPIQGWYSEDHHRKCPSPTLIFEVGQSSSAIVAWVLYPLRPDVDAGQIGISAVSGPDSSRLEFKVQSDDKIDSISILNGATARSSAGPGSTSIITIARDGEEVFRSA
jgi:uncharacterized heparinase superfamily protein